MSEASDNEVVIRRCESSEERDECVRLQSRVWQYTEADLLPSSVLRDAAETGGQLLGAFRVNELIGFAVSFVGLKGNSPYLHSNMTAVLPEYRSKGVGKMLKLAQREDGIARGIDHMEWTFDPLRIRNAHFNIVRLGVVVRQYLPNLYGPTSSPLHQGLPTDRLVAEWWWKSSRVLDILRGESPSVSGESRNVRIPAAVRDFEAQSQVRDQLQGLFSDGWAISNFERAGDSGTYVLHRWSDIDKT